MKEVNYWEQFWATGKIDDYLSYRADLSGAFGQADFDGCSGKREEKGSGADFGDASFDGSYRG